MSRCVQRNDPIACARFVRTDHFSFATAPVVVVDTVLLVTLEIPMFIVTSCNYSMRPVSRLGPFTGIEREAPDTHMIGR